MGVITFPVASLSLNAAIVDKFATEENTRQLCRASYATN